jgi:hypothetical protein
MHATLNNSTCRCNICKQTFGSTNKKVAHLQLCLHHHLHLRLHNIHAPAAAAFDTVTVVADGPQGLKAPQGDNVLKAEIICCTLAHITILPACETHCRATSKHASPRTPRLRISGRWTCARRPPPAAALSCDLSRNPTFAVLNIQLRNLPAVNSYYNSLQSH